MIIHEAIFLKSSSLLKQLPDPVYPEYAFIGRSNVGKSSLINMLMQRKSLAKTSGKPGKTVTINHFFINKTWYLVDLPGYGYAKRAKSLRNQWKGLMYQYLRERKNLVYTFILVDSRIDPQQNDLELMEWMAVNQLPFVIVFTKTDKLTDTKLTESLSTYKKQLLNDWEELPIIFLTSAQTAKGREDVLTLIDKENQQFQAYSSSISN
ncbi:MAG: ribosome biogenesis GTP-binding protein YihA/YsxC [Bacteroidales bacterium]|nr:ribosome biogenesis GTP-binding protein YihA/YsxC [Bacteroidales bacterium]